MMMMMLLLNFSFQKMMSYVDFKYSIYNSMLQQFLGPGLGMHFGDNLGDNFDQLLNYLFQTSQWYILIVIFLMLFTLFIHS
jgi:hypothetical protein